MKKNLVIATRQSRLALWQAEFVRAKLTALYPHIAVDILSLTTRGDRVQDQPLAAIGGKGLFVKELEQALLDGRAQLAVHSLKDVPAVLDPAFSLAAVLERHSPWDALISPRGALGDLPAGSRLGTSSLRRGGQILAHHPHLRLVPIRGNVDTRLNKLARGDCEALILAAAGIERLGLDISYQVLPQHTSLPAVAQGALAIETLSDQDEIKTLLAPLHHEPTSLCVRAERAFSAAMGGNCQLPLAAHAHVEGKELLLDGLVTQADGKKQIRDQRRGSLDQPERLGAELAASLQQKGAADILRQYVNMSDHRAAKAP